MRRDGLRKPLEISILVFGIAAALAFVCLLVFGRLRPGHQPIFYDSVIYYEGARNFFLSPGMKTLLGHERPVYAWPLLLFYKLLGADPSANRLCLDSLLYSLLVGLLSLIWIARIAKTGLWVALWAFTLACSFFPVPRAGAHFNGDVLMFGACLGLAAGAMSWISSPRPGFRQSLGLAALFAFSVNVKPVVVPWAMAWGGLLWAHAAWSGRLRQPDSLRRLAAFTTGTSLLVWIFWPKHLWEYIQGIRFNNEALDIFVHQSSRLESFFWYPIELYRNLPIIQLVLLGLVLAYLVVVGIRDRKRILESARPVSALWIAWILAVTYISIFLRSKDARMYLLLFPTLFILATVTAARAGEGRWKESLAVRFGALASFIAAIVTFSQWGGFFGAPSGDLAAGPNHRIELSLPFETLESSGVLKAYEAIQADSERAAKGGSAPDRVTLLLLQNPGLFSSSTFNPLPWSLGTLSQPASLSPRIAAFDQTSRHGMWGIPGGIPLGFFSALYILHCPESRCYSSNPATQRISARLAGNDPIFMEGLTRLERIPTPYGSLELLRRDRMPSAKAFVRIVTELAAADEDNLWNYPFILAASRLTSGEALKSTEARYREVFRSGRRPPYSEYALLFEWGKAVYEDNRTSLGKILYPEYFTRGNQLAGREGLK